MARDIVKSPFIDQIFADPLFWGLVIQSLHTLTPEVYIGGECLDFNLRTHWMKEKNHVSMWFLHLEGVRSLQSISGPEANELRHLRGQLGLTNEEDVNVRPVIFIVHHVDHYFVVVADYEEDVMYVYGRHVTLELAGVYSQDEEDWGKWHGNLLWMRLPKLFQWEGCSLTPSAILSVNWPQVSVK